MTSDWTVVHDFGFALGGAERVTAVLAQDVLPDCDVLAFSGHRAVFAELGLARTTLAYRRWLTPRYYRQASIVLPLLCGARRPIEGNVLASSYAFAHHVRATGVRIVYCHSPLRQLWSGSEMYSAHRSRAGRFLVDTALRPIRRADLRAAQNAGVYVANSHAVAERIRHYYGIEPAAVVHPPYDAAFFPTATPRLGHYVWAGRIVEPYKKLAPLIEAFRGTDRTLVVAGTGRDEERLRAGAPPNVTFVGHRSVDELAALYRQARAVIFPSEDDFGLVPIEAMACGTPVIALGRGGARETVEDGGTGLLFDEPEPAQMADAITRFEHLSWDHSYIADYATAFSRRRFVEQMHDVIADATGSAPAPRIPAPQAPESCAPAPESDRAALSAGLAEPAADLARETAPPDDRG